ncbi:MAG: molecular chaperone HtpG [Clostridia bacterium]|nr:molecular chaperone HtpG [Clostridia bacterium]
MKKGNISIHAQNIMPVIKRWLYSDKDIFIRELTANGCDAVTKLRMASPDRKDEDLRVTVTVDKEAGELRFSDNGVGMTADEVTRYINQVAFSGAEEFLKNYSDDDKNGIIGHFGLGFYSAFMAADLVTIDTLSWQEGAEPVLWQSKDGMRFEMGPGGRQERGTTVVLHIAEEEKDFLDPWRVREVLEKYCGYMSVPIYLEEIKPPKADVSEEDKDAEPKGPELINDTHPLWLKNPKDCTEDEYKETYRKLFNVFDEPLFWIHLNVDYPFNLKGILYFPKLRKDLGGQEGQIKLFNRQVFVADNIKEVIPEFLMLLKGVIDCPDLPLNVSRSFLQNDGYVRKLSQHITKKVADKLLAIHKDQPDQYNTYWDDIHPFIKYGCIKDRRFYDMVKDILIFKTTEGEYLTLDEYRARNRDKVGSSVVYTTEASRQAVSVALYRARGIDVVVMDTLIDVNFMSFLEMEGADDKLKFVRVDAGIDGLKDEGEAGEPLDTEKLTGIFREALSQPELEVTGEALSDKDLPLLLLEDEQLRRYREMSVMYGQNFSLPEKYKLVLNTSSDTVRAIAGMTDETVRNMLCQQLYDLARLSSRPLEGDQLRAFMKRSGDIAALLAEKAQ